MIRSLAHFLLFSARWTTAPLQEPKFGLKKILQAPKASKTEQKEEGARNQEEGGSIKWNCQEWKLLECKVAGFRCHLR